MGENFRSLLFICAYSNRITMSFTFTFSKDTDSILAKIPKIGPCKVKPQDFLFFAESRDSICLRGPVRKATAQLKLDKHGFQNKSAKVHCTKRWLIDSSSLCWRRTEIGRNKDPRTVPVRPRLSSHNFYFFITCYYYFWNEILSAKSCRKPHEVSSAKSVHTKLGAND